MVIAFSETLPGESLTVICFRDTIDDAVCAKYWLILSLPGAVRFSSVKSMSMIAFDVIMKVYCHLAKSFGVVNLKVIGLRAA